MSYILESLAAIREYKEYNEIVYKPNGIMLYAEIIAKNEEEEIYRELTEFSFANNKYDALEINILWPISDVVMRQLGLYKGYNAQFQRFAFENGKLVIYAKTMTIIVGSIQDPLEEELRDELD